MPKLKHLAIRTEDTGKLASFYCDVFEMQVLTYLRLTGLKLGLLINFGEALVKNGHAYVAKGHVLFNVPSMKDYGRLLADDFRQGVSEVFRGIGFREPTGRGIASNEEGTAECTRNPLNDGCTTTRSARTKRSPPNGGRWSSASSRS